MPNAFPDKTQLDFYLGGGGYPQSGEISIEFEFQGSTKYFGVYGQTKTTGDYGYSLDLDEPKKCKPRYVAVGVYVIDGTDVKPTDEVTIEVGVQTKSTVKDLEYIAIPEMPSVSMRDDPLSRFELLSDSAANIYISLVSLIAIASYLLL